MREIKMNTCSNIVADFDIRCKDVVNAFNNDVDTTLKQLCETAMYTINMRAVKKSDYKHIRLEFYNGTDKYLQTIYYKDVKRAEIIGTIGNPFTFELKTYPATNTPT